MFRLRVRDHVMVAHSLPRPVFGPAQGLHGATFVVELTVWRPELDEDRVVMDLGVAAGLLGDVLADLRYANLDAHPELAGTLTTTEALAELVARRVAAALPAGHGCVRVEVDLREHPDASAGFRLDLFAE